MDIQRIKATPDALDLIRQLRDKYGPLMFHQSGGCCDGSSPMCFEKGEFRLGDGDVLLGEVGDAEFYMSADQYEYWKHTQLTLDITKGRGSSFSLEIPTGYRFIIRSRVFSMEEIEVLLQQGIL